jgi:anti-sigma regulatory factor (Ser/Thr protein kinase)
MGQASGKEILTIPNDPKRLGAVREFVERMVNSSPLDRSDCNKLVLAVDEAVTNIMEHGYGKGRDGSIEIEISYDAATFCILIRDEGRFFNPELAPNPDVTDHLRHGKKKGLGIFLMRQIMDEIKYRYKDGIRNELILTKRIKRQEATP